MKFLAVVSFLIALGCACFGAWGPAIFFLALNWIFGRSAEKRETEEAIRYFYYGY